MKYKTSIAQNHGRKTAWINIDLDKLYTQPSYNPGRQWGPLQLQQLPGRGRGLVSERELPMAETVLVCEPLAGGALTGPQGTPLGPEQLAMWLAAAQEGGRLGPADRVRARLLYDGTPDDSPSSLRNRGATLNDFRKLDDKLRRAADAPKKPKGRGFGAPAAPAAVTPPASSIDAATLGAAPLTTDEIVRLATYDSWGNDYGELGVTALRKEHSEAIVGLWPEFALLNHSCAPNTVAFTVGQLLIVQAARSLPAGTELTTSYLGEAAQSPMERRREWLRNSYGFHCECERCKAEASAPSSVSAAVTAAYELATSEEVTAVVSGATARSDRGALREVEGRLGAAVGRLEDEMEAAGLGEQLRAWLRSSAFGAYHTLATIRDLPDPDSKAAAAATPGASFSDPEVPRQLAAIVGAVAPATDPHLYLALEWMVRTAELLPRDDPRVAEAAQTCLRAHLTRYGRVSDAVLRNLIQARSQVPSYLGRLSLGDAPLAGSTAASAGAAASGAAPSLFGPRAASASLAQLQQVAAAVAAEMAAMEAGAEGAGAGAEPVGV